jgi:DNA modification methylase
MTIQIRRAYVIADNKLADLAGWDRFASSSKTEERSHTNTFELGQHGRYRTNIWEYAGVNTFRNRRLDELAMHPTVKPAAMSQTLIRDLTRRAEIVLDTFAGSSRGCAPNWETVE